MPLANLANINKLQWHEGMLLSPQHFQYGEMRLEQLLYAASTSSAYTSWGILDFSIDQNMLAQGIIEISQLLAILPDGALVIHNAELAKDEAQPFNLRYNLADLGLKSATDLTICLCLHQSTDNKQRYESVEYSNVVDENSSDNVINLPLLRPKIFLNPAEVPSECSGFPLLKLTFDGKQFALKSFLPASLNIPNGHPTRKQLSSIVLNIRQKAAFLINKTQQTTSAPILRETHDTLKPLIACLCILEPLIGLERLHPERLFDHLLNIAANLLPMQTTQIPGVLPTYDPFDPGSSIEFFLNLFEKTISTIQQKFLSIPFHQQDRLFYLHLQSAYLDDTLYIGFRCPPGTSEKQMFEWVQESIIACDDKIDVVTTRRISGAIRAAVADDNVEELIPNPGTIIFAINKSDEFIKSRQNLNIFNPGDTPDKRPLDITLFVRQNDSP
jgi:type VI secretion system protein ImpJ